MYRIIFTIVILSTFIKSQGQGTCPANIGFESGGFQNWNCYTGVIENITGAINFFPATPAPPVATRHTILKNSVPQDRDLYGDFPVNCPNGSGYSIKLGNALTGQQVDRVSYTFTVPADKNEYSIIYNYAIVFQDPGHPAVEQPKFVTKVFDEAAGQYLSCGAFEYVASAGIPGFQLWAQSTPANQIWYKDWSPVTVKLVGCAGKQITLEFTVNDCAKGGHFGYAYLDINENCSSPVSGNVYCNGATSLTLAAPFGFQSYNWYTADFSQKLGTSNILKLDPVPPVGTKYALEIIPYPGLGCQDTIYSTIELSPEAFHFKAVDTFVGCLSVPANFTHPDVTAGSSPGLTFSYFTDSGAINYVPTATSVSAPGKYFIKAVNNSGCTETKSFELIFRELTFATNDPTEMCFPNTVDLTHPSVIKEAAIGASISYWQDPGGLVPLLNPSAISKTGVYYLKASRSLCSKTLPVNVTVWDPSYLVVNGVNECASADITAATITLGSAAIFTQFTQWMNAAASIPVSNPKNITASGTYYIKGSSTSGCSFVKPLDVIIRPTPDFTIDDPGSVLKPKTVSITDAASGTDNYNYSYWKDPASTVPLENPGSISRSGTYYIKATDSTGCSMSKPVTVTVVVPYHPIIKYPNTFSPNKDGVNDGFRIDIAGDVTYRHFKVYDRWGRIVFESKDPLEYWYGDKAGVALPVGTYYWVLELVNNNNQDFYRKMGSVTILR